MTEIPVEFVSNENEGGSNPAQRECEEPEAAPLGDTSVAAPRDTNPSDNTEVDERVKQLEDRLLRVLADFDNYRRRTREEQARIAEDSKAELLKKLLPVLDEFSYLLDHLADQDGPLAEGARLIHQKLANTLKDEGLEPIGAVGERFDPEWHEAVNVEKVHSAHQDQKITAVTKQGYKFRDRALRPCQVVVGQYDPE